MSNSLMNIARIALVLSIAGTVVAGCGRKGDLDRPSTPLEQQNVRQTGAPGEVKRDAVPERPFVLDPLL